MYSAIARLRMQALKEAGNDLSLVERKELIDALHQDLISALPDVSFRKHFIHRRKVKGFSQDMLRTFAQNQYQAAQNIANIKFRSKIQKQLFAAQQRVDHLRGDKMALNDAVQELVKREADLAKCSVNPIAAALSQLGFIGAMGFNVSSALINLLQVPMVTLPHLIGQYGEKAAGITPADESQRYRQGIRL